MSKQDAGTVSREELRSKLKAKIRGARDQSVVSSTRQAIDPTSALMQMGVDDVDVLRKIKDIKPEALRSLLQTAPPSKPKAVPESDESDDEEAPPPPAR